ncbi:Uncharacterised protein [Burkholderia pseudomallei]|uniref:hypothetical protein n=1 Tax=Burkholderia pseudomallei TaxID=28450 RepID=UPI000F081F5A|nr:hypothetical protein [Burkholderia pseudomallei]CAJ7234410.1 Uncharacterised protein [Burkholderia pseudomallei]VBC15618.1 Uncharacterised protein [Burkholderia pseudomallei]VBS98930.1 Uncharacterised protein [Burkholderia pseudomallei]
MPSVVPLLNIASKYLSSDWMQVFVATFLLVQLAIQIDKAHRALSASGKQWKKTGKAVMALAKRLEVSINRMMGYQDNRPPRPAIEATLLAGDVLLYWVFSAWLFAEGSVLMLLVIVKRPHELKLVAMSVAGTLVLYVFAAIYRNMGAKRFHALKGLFRENAGDRRRQMRMMTSIASCAFAIATIEYLAWPYIKGM